MSKPPEGVPEPPRTTLTLLLGVGGALVFMTFMRLSLQELGWIVFAPFLVALYAPHPTWRRHLAVLGTLLVAFVATISKMVTSEIPWIAAPMYGIPMACAYFAAIAFAATAHHRAGPRWGLYTFACSTVALSWMQYTYTPGSSWGALAHTQLDNLALVQLVSLTGIGGVTFLVALGSGLTAVAWTSGVRAIRRDLIAFALLLAGSLLYGQIRLLRPPPGEPTRIGAVVSPVTHKEFREAYADIDTLRRLDEELFARTERAADLGARVVVWNELATIVTREGEMALADRGESLARRRGVALVMAYGLVESMRPFHYVNKYRFYLPDGTLADEYRKRHPVPADPEDPGSAHARVVAFEGVRYSGGICYDYGFPAIARDNASDGASVALVPSSDWRGIDPEHARMALMNAVAVGLPMLRPVRASTSLASDQYGRVLGSLRFDRPSDGVMVVAMPTERVETLYASTGELVPGLALAFCVLAFLRVTRTRGS